MVLIDGIIKILPAIHTGFSSKASLVIGIIHRLRIYANETGIKTGENS